MVDVSTPQRPTRIEQITSAATHDLRRRVLRVGTPSTSVTWDGDDLDSTVHLGVLRVGSTVPIAISTWLRVNDPDIEHGVGIQLRGMATDPDPEIRGRGHGSRLLDAGIERASEHATHLWANARSTALDFYVARGFRVVGPEFHSVETQLAHRRILLEFS
jgi:predicted GNAT family N-acyltransferase